jgi:hypothetical protein
MDESQPPQTNRGTGAGGANTNLYGKKFEEQTNNYTRLLENGFSEVEHLPAEGKAKPKKSSSQWLCRVNPDGTKHTFVTQSLLKQFIHQIMRSTCSDIQMKHILLNLQILPKNAL